MVVTSFFMLVTSSDNLVGDCYLFEIEYILNITCLHYIIGYKFKI